MRGVVLVVDRPDAGPRAPLDVEEQAGLPEPLWRWNLPSEQVRIGNVRSSRSRVSRMALGVGVGAEVAHAGLAAWPRTTAARGHSSARVTASHG